MAFLILEDGSRYAGTSFGRKAPVTGEVVFTTGMTGYQETLTDPSYGGQIVCMTYPLIGNVGINDTDMESALVGLRGLVVSELCELPSNWKMEKELCAYLDEQGVTGIYGVDTRALTRRIRQNGALRGRIVEGEPTQADFDALRTFEDHEQVRRATCKAPYVIPGGETEIAVIDFGAKNSLIQCLTDRGCTVKGYPAGTDAQTILENGCDGVFLTNGPGNPADCAADIETVRALSEQKPVFGVCLGHLILALAMGCGVKRMTYGHHGANQPVKDLAKNCCYVTTQSHGYMVDPDALAPNAVVSHVNWNDQTPEGLRYTDRRAFSVQFHPSANGGPRETSYLFGEFLNGIRA